MKAAWIGIWYLAALSYVVEIFWPLEMSQLHNVVLHTNSVLVCIFVAHAFKSEEPKE